MNPCSLNHNENIFYLIVDDGGFEKTFPDNKGKVIAFSAYENLLKLARQFNTQIVLACTSKFLDVKGISRTPAPHYHSKKLIKFLEKNNDKIIIADHGYDHLFENRYTEFYNYYEDKQRLRDEQRFHLDLSISIYKSLGWQTPKIFAPPAHGWEPGITDQIYAERGFEYLTSLLWIKKPICIRHLFKPCFFSDPVANFPKNSAFLKILPRLSIGIPSNTTHLNKYHMWRAYRSVYKKDNVYSLIFHGKQTDQPHNYIAHIANFTGDKNYEKWELLINKLLSNNIYIPQTFRESVDCWEKLNLK